MKRIIHAIKYFHRKDLINPLVEEFLATVQPIHQEGSCFIPIPMPQSRKYMRGYNHAEAIAKEFSKLTTIQTDSTLLLRSKKQKIRQVTASSRSERIHNQRGVFIVNNKHQNYIKHAILIDDVTTTGATLREARKMLLASGIKSVEAYTLAH